MCCRVNRLTDFLCSVVGQKWNGRSVRDIVVIGETRTIYSPYHLNKNKNRLKTQRDGKAEQEQACTRTASDRKEKTHQIRMGISDGSRQFSGYKT